MASARAKRLCPEAIFLPPRMAAYREASRQIMEILQAYSDLVEPVSIDEAYIDATTNKAGIAYASQVARAIKQDILTATQLTASAGVGPNKFIAKIASDMHKPDGLTVVPPEDIPSLLENLPVRKIPGIGPATEGRLSNMGIRTVGELRQWPEQRLVEAFGKTGRWFYALARGEDDREVEVTHVRKSIGAESTFDVDLSDVEDMRVELRQIALDVERRMEKSNVHGKTITLKITFADFLRITRSTTLDRFVCDADTLWRIALDLLAETDAAHTPVRLLGITVANLDNAPEEPSVTTESGPRQLTFPFYSVGEVPYP